MKMDVDVNATSNLNNRDNELIVKKEVNTSISCEEKINSDNDCTNPCDQNTDENSILKRKNSTEDNNLDKKRRKKLDYISSSDEEEYCLIVSNLPNDWTYVQIKNYIDTECGPVDEIEMLKQGLNCAIRLTFQSLQKCKDALNNLENKEVQDRKLHLEMSGTHDEKSDIDQPPPPEHGPDMTELIPGVSPPLDKDGTWDPKNTFGLKPRFLKSLGIKPPLTQWIHVTNFRCDKSELKEVLELAGRVVFCSLIFGPPKYAKVMYSHPLEAVQAISMLNEQKFYGAALKIVMENIDNIKYYVLPKGMANIGNGLGIQGRPIANIAKEYKNFLKKQKSLINPTLFVATDSDDTDSNKIDIDLKDTIKNESKDFIPIKTENNKNFKLVNVEDLRSPTSHTVKTDSDPKPIADIAGINHSECVESPKPCPYNSSQIPSQTQTNKIAPTSQGSVNTGISIRMSQPESGQNLTQPFHSSISNRPLSGSIPRPGPFNPLAPAQFRSSQGPYALPGSNFGHQSLGGGFGPRQMPIAMNAMGPGSTTLPTLRGLGPTPMPVPQERGPFAMAQGPRPMYMPQGPGIRPIPMPQEPGPRPVPMAQIHMNNVRPEAIMRPNAPVPKGVGTTAHFANLPPSTTFPLLCEKLARCGQVMSVQLTTPGCAVATFAHRASAERCFQMFNKMKVEGHIIDVKLM